MSDRAWSSSWIVKAIALICLLSFANIAFAGASSSGTNKPSSSVKCPKGLVVALKGDNWFAPINTTVEDGSAAFRCFNDEKSAKKAGFRSKLPKFKKKDKKQPKGLKSCPKFLGLNFSGSGSNEKRFGPAANFYCFKSVQSATAAGYSSIQECSTPDVGPTPTPTDPSSPLLDGQSGPDGATIGVRLSDGGKLFIGGESVDKSAVRGWLIGADGNLKFKQDIYSDGSRITLGDGGYIETHTNSENKVEVEYVLTTTVPPTILRGTIGNGTLNFNPLSSQIGAPLGAVQAKRVEKTKSVGYCINRLRGASSAPFRHLSNLMSPAISPGCYELTDLLQRGKNIACFPADAFDAGVDAVKDVLCAVPGGLAGVAASLVASLVDPELTYSELDKLYSDVKETTSNLCSMVDSPLELDAIVPDGGSRVHIKKATNVYSAVCSGVSFLEDVSGALGNTDHPYRLICPESPADGRIEVIVAHAYTGQRIPARVQLKGAYEEYLAIADENGVANFSVPFSSRQILNDYRVEAGYTGFVRGYGAVTMSESAGKFGRIIMHLEPLPDNNKGALNIYVVDKETELPVEGVKVWTNSSSGPQQLTDSKGLARLLAVTPGEVNVFVSGSSQYADFEGTINVEPYIATSGIVKLELAPPMCVLRDKLHIVRRLNSLGGVSLESNYSGSRLVYKVVTVGYPQSVMLWDYDNGRHESISAMMPKDLVWGDRVFINQAGTKVGFNWPRESGSNWMSSPVAVFYDVESRSISTPFNPTLPSPPVLPVYYIHEVVALSGDTNQALTEGAISGGRGQLDVMNIENGTFSAPLVTPNRVPNDATMCRYGGSSEKGAISGDGETIAFSSTYSNFIAGDTNGVSDVFFRKGKTGVLRRITGSSQPNGASFSPKITPNGRFIAFVSDASNLVNDDTNNKRDVFVYDTFLDRIERVSLTESNSQANGDSGVNNNFSPPELAISSNGRFVAFPSLASNMKSGLVASANLVVRDRRLDQTKVFSQTDQGLLLSSLGSLTLSGDGVHVFLNHTFSNLAGMNYDIYQSTILDCN